MSYAPTPYGLNGRPRPAFGRAGVKSAPRQARQAPQAPQPSAPEPESYERPADMFHADGRFGIGRVFARLFGVMRTDFVTVFALVALFAAPERIAHYALHGQLGTSTGTLLLAVSSFALQLAVIHLSLRRFAGAPASLGACCVRALTALIPALLIAALSGLAMACAAFLLIAPGFMVMLSWSLILPVYLAEEVSLFSTFKRSSALTKGHRWKILGAFLLLGLMLGAVAGMLMPIWGVHGVMGAAIFFSQNWLIKLVFNAAFGLLLAAIYHELAGAREADAF